jgi:hypothetical protein
MIEGNSNSSSWQERKEKISTAKTLNILIFTFVIFGLYD